MSGGTCTLLVPTAGLLVWMGSRAGSVAFLPANGDEILRNPAIGLGGRAEEGRGVYGRSF